MAGSVATPVRAVIVDGDNTLWKGRIATGIGEQYMRRELTHLHVRKLLRGLGARKRVMGVVAASGESGSGEGLRAFYGELSALGQGNREEMRKFALRHIRRHVLRDTKEFLSRINPAIPRILATTGGSTAAEVAAEVFNIRHVLANQDIFDETGRLKGVQLSIRGGEEKYAAVLKQLRGMGLLISQCIAIGDDHNDVPILMAVPPGRRFASPLATGDVMHIPGISYLSHSPHLIKDQVALDFAMAC